MLKINLLFAAAFCLVVDTAVRLLQKIQRRQISVQPSRSIIPVAALKSQRNICSYLQKDEGTACFIKLYSLFLEE